MRLREKMMITSLAIMLFFGSLSAFISYSFSRNILLESIIQSKKNEIVFIDNRLNDLIRELQKKLEVLANDYTFNEYMTLLENASGNYEKVIQGNLLQLFLHTRLNAENMFEEIYLVTDGSIIGISVKNNNVVNKRIEADKFMYKDKTDMVNFLQAYGTDNFIEHDIIEEKMLVVKMTESKYLVGILDFDQIIEYEDERTTCLIYNQNKEYIYRSNVEFNADIVIEKYSKSKYRKDFVEIELYGNPFITMSYYSNNEAFQYILLMETEIILDIYKKPIMVIVSATTLCYIILGIISFYLSRKIVEPIHHFAEELTKIKDYSNKRFINDFKQSNKQNNLKDKILFFYCLNILPIVFIIIFSYVSFRDVLIRETQKSSYGVSQMIGRNIDLTVENYISFAKNIALDLELQKKLVSQIGTSEKSGGDKENTIDDWSAYISTALLNKGVSMKDISYINFYNEKFELFYSTNYNSSANAFLDGMQIMKNVDIYTWYTSNNHQNMALVWRIKYIPQPLMNVKTGSTLGFVEIGVDNLFASGLDFFSSDMDSRKYFINKNDYAVMSVSGFNYFGERELEILDYIKLDEKNFYMVQEGRNNFMINVYHIKNTDWVLIYMESVSEILYNNRIILYSNFILLIGLVVSIIIVSIIFQRKFLEPLEWLQDKMGTAHIRNTFKINHIKGDNEFVKLAENFEQMMSRLYELNKRIKEKEKEKYDIEKRRKEAEIIALQAQMNPHFLSNIFVTLGFLLRLNMTQEAQKMFTATGDLLRVGMYKGNSIISVEEELNHVKAYVEIQQFRYDNRIFFQERVYPGILGYKLPKFILQPVVENAIEHGLKDRTRIDIEVHIKIVNNDKLIIEVNDNGAGIDAENLKKIRERLSAGNDTKHVGLTNINERIKLNFGQEYGLYITGVHGKETKVIITLPILG